VPGGVAEHPEGVVLVGVRHPRGTQLDDLAFRVVDAVVLDLDVEVKLLGAARVGKRSYGSLQSMTVERSFPIMGSELP
jgi:hypothetical protein